MLIGICGGKFIARNVSLFSICDTTDTKLVGICAGKHSVADFLVRHHDFTQLRLSKNTSSPLDNADQISKATPPTTNGISDPHSFQRLDDLVNFVTSHWRDRWVTTDLWDEDSLNAFLRRPFFLLVSIDAPLSTRWKRFTEKYIGTHPPCISSNTANGRVRSERNEDAAMSLEDFVHRNDEQLFNQDSGLARVIGRAQVRLLNSTSSLSSLYIALERLQLTSEERLRPSWDQYFMQMASLAAQRSNCMKRRVGCVLICERRVISTGYNGTPRGLKNCNEGGCE